MHIDFSSINPSNLNGIHSAMGSQSSAISAIMQKVESSLQTSLALITYRNDNCTQFGIKFIGEDIEYRAVLSFDKGLYSIIGMPKLGNTVIVIHNNGNNAHILFVANDKDLSDPPLYGSTTAFSKSISSSKCMG